MRLFLLVFGFSWSVFAQDCLNVVTMTTQLKTATQQKPLRHELTDIRGFENDPDPEKTLAKIERLFQPVDFLEYLGTKKISQDGCRSVTIEGVATFDIVAHAKESIELAYSQNDLDVMAQSLTDGLIVEIINQLIQSTKRPIKKVEIKEGESLEAFFKRVTSDDQHDQVDQAILNAIIAKFKGPEVRDDIFKQITTKVYEQVGSMRVTIKQLSPVRYETEIKNLEESGNVVSKIVVTAADDLPIEVSRIVKTMRTILENTKIKK